MSEHSHSGNAMMMLLMMPAALLWVEASEHYALRPSLFCAQVY
jgi:hypothetical protein